MSEQLKPCIYHRISLGYEVGLGKIYTEQEIEQAKQSPSFEREYNLKYLGKVGNVFSPIMVDKAVELGERLKHIPVNQYTHHFGGCDTGWSKVTPLYIGELMKEEGCVRIIYYEGFDKSTPEEVGNRIHELNRQFVNLHWFIDGADRGFINTVKTKFGESSQWVKEDDVSTTDNKIIPVNFGREHKQLLEHCFMLLSNGKVAIPKKYDRLITALRTAQATEWNLNKEDTVNDDDLDSLRLLLKKAYFGKRD